MKSYNNFNEFIRILNVLSYLIWSCDIDQTIIYKAHMLGISTYGSSELRAGFNPLMKNQAMYRFSRENCILKNIGILSENAVYCHFNTFKNVRTSEPRQANLCLRAFRHDKF